MKTKQPGVSRNAELCIQAAGVFHCSFLQGASFAPFSDTFGFRAIARCAGGNARYSGMRWKRNCTVAAKRCDQVGSARFPCEATDVG